MNTGECRHLLAAAVGGTQCTAQAGTSLGEIAAEELEMARAYLSDGTGFEDRGDLVNALASYLYAFGWLHFGRSYGTLTADKDHSPCPFVAPFEPLPPALHEKLVEKTARYERLLDTAGSSVVCAPDPATPSYDMAVRVHRIAEIYLERGQWLRGKGRDVDALAAFSYGHGWLDTGVRAGLFRIEKNRDIFTV